MTALISSALCRSVDILSGRDDDAAIDEAAGAGTTFTDAAAAVVAVAYGKTIGEAVWVGRTKLGV